MNPNKIDIHAKNIPGLFREISLFEQVRRMVGFPGNFNVEKWRRLLAQLLVGGSLGLVGASPAPAAIEGDSMDKPNILMITVDDMHWDSVGVYGSAVEDITPNIDALAGQSMRFHHAYVPAAVCTPCRHSILTGRYPHRNGAGEGFGQVPASRESLPKTLENAGYRNGIICKIVEQYLWDYQINLRQTGWGRNPDIFYRESLNFMNEAREEDSPFFLMANSMDPHRPFAGSRQEMDYGDFQNYAKDAKAPSRTYGPEEVEVPGFLPDLPLIRQEMAEYYSSVRRADDSVGAFLRALEDSGMADNTIVIFLSDHGMAVPYAKADCYYQSAKTPLMIRWPGHVEPGSESDALVSLVDLAPSLLDMVGLPALQEADGRSMRGILRGREEEIHDYIYCEYFKATDPQTYPMRAIFNKQYGYIFNAWAYGGKGRNGEPQSGLTWPAMAAAGQSDEAIGQRVDFYLHRTTEEFYDYQSDPDALRNLIDDATHQERIAEMRERLLDQLESSEDHALSALRNRGDLEALAAYVQGLDSRYVRSEEEQRRQMREQYSKSQWHENYVSWNQNVETGLRPVPGGDGPVLIHMVDGRVAVETNREAGLSSYIYLDAHDGFQEALGTDGNPVDLLLEIRFLDRPGLKIRVHYNSGKHAYELGPSIEGEGSGKWITRTVLLKEAMFDGSQNLGTDLRLHNENPVPMAIEFMKIQRAGD